ncbi:MAG: hypothetical protein OER88_12715, partial [Planctomycetota bacterium]|nr:hypothetical protein [Planctomycetota bacterium]
MKRWLLVLLVLASARADEPAAIVYARVPFADAQFKMEDYRFWRSVFIVADAPAVLMSNEGAIYVAAPAGQAVAGTVAWRGGAGWRHATFRIADPSKHQTTKAKFKKARAIRYRRLVDEGHAGAALFRYRWSSLVTDEDRRGAARRRADRHDFDLMTGGRAFAENLQLDRHLPESAAGEATVELDSIKGITVRPYEWKLDDEPIPVDRLARFVPENQYAVFFKSAAALRATAALLGDQGTPLLRWMEPRAEDLHTLERYERQLGVDLATLPGKSVAITGSDPYFEDGTDLALLLEGVSADDLPRPAGRRMTGSAFGTAWHGFVAERREVSSYRANVAGAAVVSNSRVQLERILAVAAGKKSGMATLDEFRFFRRRYALGGDEAFLMVTDGAIRNWCGPRWRIAASRRRRALSEMLDWQAARADGDAAPARAGSVDLALRIDGGRVVSDRYGAIDFLTPIAELDFTRVTEDEARLYGVWRDGYERFWSNFFDPIAARLAHTDDGLELDVSVMPLIANSDYRRFIRVAQGVTIGATAGDRHDGSLLHMVFAINAESKPVKDAWQFAGAMMGIEVNPMAWLGTSWSVYVDESPFFTDLAQAENP